MKTVVYGLLITVTAVLAYSCQKTDKSNTADIPDKLKITWGSDALFANSDTLYLYGYKNTSDSTKTFRKMKMRASLFDSLAQICRYHINNPFHGKLDQSTCFSGISICIALQSGAAIQSVEYNYLLDEKQLPDTLLSLRRFLQIIPYPAN